MGHQRPGIPSAERNVVDPAPFRAKPAASGFYKTWKEKFGPEEWGVLT